MQNRWSESEAARLGGAEPARQELALLAYATHLLGAEPDLAMHGGGNTSCKGSLANAFGEAQPALFIKPSGMALADVGADDFVALDLRHLQRLVDVPAMSDERMAGELACHTLRPATRRASVETLAHAVLPQPFVLHTHPSAILALCNRDDGAAVVATALGNEVATVPYAPAGLALARAIRDTLDRFPTAKALVLMHHGLVTWGSTAHDAYDVTVAQVSRAEGFLARSRVRELHPSLVSTAAERERRYLALAPVMRSILGPQQADAVSDRTVLDAALDAELVRVLDAPEGKRLALSPPISPDYLIRAGRLPLWLDQPALDDAKAFREQLGKAVAAYQDDYRAYVRAHAAGSGFDEGDFLPRALMIPGLGVVCAGKDAEGARMIRDIMLQGLAVKVAIFEGGADYLPLADDHLCDMEFRACQQAKSAPGVGDASQGLRGSVALVTGAAGAIGSGICEALLAQGCHVAASDLPGASLEALVEDLGRCHPSRVVAAAMDVTDEASVSAGFARAIRAWGGIDAVIVNAGIAHVAPLAELSLEAFRKLEAVNVEGTLLSLAEAGRHFALQGTGGDVVLVSTKNVFAPGAGFGAYSATKAASHQLARIASLEFAPLGVRVNMVAPDAVFSHGDKRSGLWAAVGPNRMKARGLDERGLEEYYRSRNLLKARVTSDHVARAVLFFLTHQTPTTGATIPVDGGLPDATPR